jgi:hypothetical protein
MGKHYVCELYGILTSQTCLTKNVKLDRTSRDNVRAEVNPAVAGVPKL